MWSIILYFRWCVTFNTFRLYDEIVRTTRGLYLINARGWFNASFIYANKSKGEEGRKKRKWGGGTPVGLSRKGSPSQPRVSLFLPSFLPSFLPRCDMRPRGVYFLWLLHAHSIILYSFLHLIPRILVLPFPQPPPISRAYAILHGAHASWTPPHAPTIPLACRHFLRPPPPPSISAGLKSKLLEIGSGRHRSPPIPQGNT